MVKITTNYNHNPFKYVYYNIYIKMSVFLVEQLLDIAASGAFLRVPETIAKLLKDLESCLEITDGDDGTGSSSASSAAAGRFDSGSNVRHFRRNPAERKPAHHGPNRYDVDALAAKASKRGPESGKKHGAEEAEDWSTMRTFKATKIETKTGIDKTINDIRVALNKLSSTNYEKQRDAVLGLVAAADTDLLDSANIRRVSKAIFDIASTNKFYSEIYASLYKELVSAHPAFRELLDEFVAGFTSMDSTPIYVDPDKDYDGFCVYSKACDIRKSTSTFLVNCAKQGLIEPDQVAFILRRFLDFITVKILEEGQGKVVEEVVENVFIISTLCNEELRKTEQWKTGILPSIKTLVQQKGDGHPSFSNRASFKCMDILDKVSL